MTKRQKLGFQTVNYMKEVGVLDEEKERENITILIR